VARHRPPEADDDEVSVRLRRTGLKALKMGYSVYVLVSASRRRTYVGQTQDLSSRLQMHNRGHVRSTRGDRPWELLFSESCESRGAAMKVEKYYKSHAGRKKLRVFIEERWPSG
jgi:putative endonuclease